MQNKSFFKRIINEFVSRLLECNLYNCKSLVLFPILVQVQKLSSLPLPSLILFLQLLIPVPPLQLTKLTLIYLLIRILGIWSQIKASSNITPGIWYRRIIIYLNFFLTFLKSLNLIFRSNSKTENIRDNPADNWLASLTSKISDIEDNNASYGFQGR